MNSITDSSSGLAVPLFITKRNARLRDLPTKWNLHRARNLNLFTSPHAYGFWLGQCHR